MRSFGVYGMLLLSYQDISHIQNEDNRRRLVIVDDLMNEAYKSLRFIHKGESPQKHQRYSCSTESIWKEQATKNTKS